MSKWAEAQVCVSNEASRMEPGYDNHVQDTLALFPENMRMYLRARSSEEANSLLRQCLLMHLGLAYLNKQLTSYSRSEEAPADIPSALTFDLTDEGYDNKAIKYAEDYIGLEEGIKEQLRCSDYRGLSDLIQIELSECLGLKKKNIELSEELSTKLGKPSGIDGKRWFGLPPEVRDVLCNGTEEEKKRFAIEGFDRKKIIDNLTEENHKMRQETTQRENDMLTLKRKCTGIEKSLEEHEKKLQIVEKERKEFEKLYGDTNKKLQDCSRKLNNITSERDRYKVYLESNERSLEEHEKKLQIVEKERKEFEKLCGDMNKESTEKTKELKKLSDQKNKLEMNMKEQKLKNDNEISQLLAKNYEIHQDRANMKEIQRQSDEYIDKLSSKLFHTQEYIELYKVESMKLKQEKNVLFEQLKREKQQVAIATENNRKLQQQVAELNKSREDALTRLSKLAGARLTQGNAEIADLSDPDRPTKLAEQFSELYDNQWTDSLEELTGNTLPEEIGVKLLLSIVLEAYRFCCKVHLGQKEALNAALVTLPPIDVEVSHTLVTTKNAEVEVDDELKSDLEKLRRKVILNAQPILQKRFRGIVLHMLQKSISKDSTDKEMESDGNEEDSEKAEKGNMEPVPLMQTDPPAADDSSRAVDLGVSELDIPDTDSESSSVQQGRFGKDGVPDRPSASTKEESGNQAVSGKPVPLQETEPPAADDSNAAGVSELDKQGTALKAEASSEQQDKFLIVGVPDTPSASTKEESGSQAVSGKPDIGDKYDNVYLNKLQTIHKSEHDENRKKQNLANSWSGKPNRRLVELQRASKSLSVNDRRRGKDSDIILILQGPTQLDNHVTVEEDYWKQYPCTFEFAKICLDICWKMRLQDPEVYMEDCEEETGSFNNDKYKAYTRTGKQLDYVVWPALYLHKNGPMLSKGVAQPKMKK